jgi:hypothetical protein
MSLEKLINIGFKKVGQWSWVNDRLVPNLFAEENSENILYSFVVNDEPMYIGKTTQKLKKRMYGYQNPGSSQFTNIRNNENIKNTLTSGSNVDLYALPDHGLLHFGSFHLNLAAGLEDSITKVLKPKWNVQGK